MTTLACSLNEKKDKELIDFIEEQNNIGFNNSTLLRVALYNYMKASKSTTNNMINMLNQDTKEKAPEVKSNVKDNNVVNDVVDEVKIDNNENINVEANIYTEVDKKTDEAHIYTKEEVTKEYLDTNNTLDTNDKVKTSINENEQDLSKEELNFFNKFIAK